MESVYASFCYHGHLVKFQVVEIDGLHALCLEFLFHPYISKKPQILSKCTLEQYIVSKCTFGRHKIHIFSLPVHPKSCVHLYAFFLSNLNSDAQNCAKVWF